MKESKRVALADIPTMVVVNPGVPRTFRFDEKHHTVRHGVSQLPTDLARHVCSKYPEVHFVKPRGEHVCGPACEDLKKGIVASPSGPSETAIIDALNTLHMATKARRA